MADEPGTQKHPHQLSAGHNADSFRLWATSDAHVIREATGDGVDPDRIPRESLRTAIEQVEGPGGFDYDIAFHLGDALDYDYETEDSFRAFRRQLECSRKGPLHWYHVGGNNDENSVLNDGVAIDNEYYRRIVDPVGEFTETSGIDNSHRPYPVDGTYERYCFDVGTIRFLFLSDRNDLPAPFGRGEGGFFVDGAITLESFQWLVRQIITYGDRILVVSCHHPLKDTTIGTGMDDSWTGKYMTLRKPNTPLKPAQRLQSVLHQIYPIAEFDTPLFHCLLSQNPGTVDMWLSGHVHHRVEETFRGRGKYARAYGGHHLNIGNLCRFRHFANIISAQSNLFTWQTGSDCVLSQVFVHDHPSLPPGFYSPEERILKLKRPFEPTAPAPTISPPTGPISIEKLPATENASLYIRWHGDCTGLLIIASPSTHIDFTPDPGNLPYCGQPIANGEIVFFGTSRSAPLYIQDPTSHTHLHIFPYNAAGGSIQFQESPLVL